MTAIFRIVAPRRHEVERPGLRNFRSLFELTLHSSLCASWCPPTYQKYSFINLNVCIASWTGMAGRHQPIKYLATKSSFVKPAKFLTNVSDPDKPASGWDTQSLGVCLASKRKQATTLIARRTYAASNHVISCWRPVDDGEERSSWPY